MSTLMNLLGVIPGISSLVESVTKTYFDTRVRLTMARLGVDKDVALGMLKSAEVQDRTSLDRLAMFTQNYVLTLILVGFAVPILIWFWKAVPYDKVLCPVLYGMTCSTDQIAGEALEITKTVIYFLFGAPSVLAIGKMWFARNRKGE